MSRNMDEGPVYYREIQKNAFLKRIPCDNGGKLRPLGNKKPPLKPMWTLFCVHNGHTPYLEQYPEPDSTCTRLHKPMWRANLKTAKHVTASVKPWFGNEFDFLVTTDDGPVRMLAHDWDSMQDWVTTLRNKLHELKVLGKGENVYCPAPAVPVSRAGTRDPTSPLPPTPAVPPVRVPGIELAPQRSTDSIEPQTDTPETSGTAETVPAEPEENPAVDRVTWDQAIQPSTSQETKMEPKSVAKICGQNICLDDSILKRNSDVTGDSDEEFFSEIDRLTLDNGNDQSNDTADQSSDYTQRVLVCGKEAKASTSIAVSERETDDRPYTGTNITVIQVSNKNPPHTAIPIVGAERNVFNFDFKQNVTINNENGLDFVNIVNTEAGSYGTVFSDSAYDHISMTTTVNLGGHGDSRYERLCLANSSAEENSVTNTNSNYEYLFPQNNASGQRNSNSGQNNSTSEQRNSNSAQNNSMSEQRNSNSAQNNSMSEQRNSNSAQNNSMSGQSSSNSTRLLNCAPLVARNVVERSHSQNSYDNGRLREILLRTRNQNQASKPNKIDQKSADTPPKPIWKRGLTEINLLSRLRGRARSDRESPTRTDNNNERNVNSPVKVIHRSRPETRYDNSRRRSNSLSNGEPDNSSRLQSLRSRQAATLRAEQARGAAVVARVSKNDAPIFADANGAVWIARWGRSGALFSGRTGDRVAAVRGVKPVDSSHANSLLQGHTLQVDILFHRVPLGRIFVLNKKNDSQNLGIKLDNECQIQNIEPNSPAHIAGVPTTKWCITEVNNRQLNIIKGSEEEMNRLSACGTEVSILIQPAPLVKKLRSSLKGYKNILSLR